MRWGEFGDSQFLGHRAGDRIKGEADAREGTMLEHTSRRVMRVKRPVFKPTSAAKLHPVFTDKLLAIDEPMRLLMT